ncbi:Yqey-like protein-domain-containing protein [Bisporella sp. PMI_857]|nr:Yqey-like protein-domain-containing protein [Bisporella sp. PMI_857]
MMSRSINRASRLCHRCYATSTTTTPPLLLKIRKDMKTAMQNKDSNRLSVLKNLLTQSLNASKTASPINTDMQVLSLIKKNATASRAASEEFKNAGRQDLADKEDSQLKIMEEYAGSVEVMGMEEIRTVIKSLVETMKGEGAEIRQGDVLKKAFSEEYLGGKPVEKKDVAVLVKQILAEP